MDKNDTIGFRGPDRSLESHSRCVAGGDGMGKAKSAVTCGCPVAAFQKMISGKYKLRIVWDLKDGPRRYGEIRTGLLRGSDGTSEMEARVPSRQLQVRAESW